jgi:hypothetical protein
MRHRQEGKGEVTIDQRDKRFHFWKVQYRDKAGIPRFARLG